tara:strand:- start:1634 stop:2554 length:921 start_codon:yes stop_codon:yes gene_type:complete
MKMVKTLGLTLFAIIFATGCAGNQAARDYYLAIQAAAQENAKSSTARYNALAQLAQSGDPGAATAATMAIALSQDQVIQPQYIESSALKWAGVLAAPVTTLGLGVVQAGVAKNASNNAAQVQMASFASNEAIQLGQQNMVSTLGGQWATGANASSQALVDLGIAGFGALNNAGDQTVALGVAGFTANENIATVGMNNLNEMGQYGMTTVSATGIAGMQNITDVSKWGMEGIWLTAENGMDGMEALGLAGMTNLTTLGTTGLGLVDSQGTNFATIISNMQETINQLGSDLADPITCSPNADGLFVCQ